MKRLSLKHLPLSMLVVFLLRSLILNSVTTNEVLMVAILAALTAFYELQLETQKIQKLNKQIEDVITHKKQQDDVIQGIRDSLSSFKLSSGLKNVR